MRSRTIPIIRFRDALVVSIQIELSDQLVLDLKEDIASELARTSAHGLVIEVSGVDLVDSFIARALRDIAQVARLMGTETIVAGLDPGMAITLVEMGMTMRGVRTALNLDTAMDVLEALAREADEVEFDIHQMDQADASTIEPWIAKLGTKLS